VALALVEHSQRTGANGDQAKLDAVNFNAVPGSGLMCDPTGNWVPALVAQCNSLQSNAQSKVNDDKNGETLGWVLTGVGGAAVVTGLVLLLTGDNPHKYDEKPKEQILGGWQFSPLVGLGGASLSASRAF
jgi:hypothetical protein